MKSPLFLEEMTKSVVPMISLIVGMILKTGRDLLSRRKLSPLQRLGVYMIMIGGGFLGWYFCLLMNYSIDDPRVPIIITVITYLAEDLSTWMVCNWRNVLKLVLKK
jgi:hypothetical protein